jgi:predicted HAD superfamily Cof-like phosphohydrolase
MSYAKGDYFGMVSEFHEAFNASNDIMLWVDLIEEETNELLESMHDGDRLNALKEAVDCAYVTTGFVLVARSTGMHDLDAAAKDRMKGVMDAAFNAAKRYREWDPAVTDEVLHEAFQRVHESNMSKLGEDGKPILREDGKVLKGPNYRKPDLTDLVRVN